MPARRPVKRFKASRSMSQLGFGSAARQTPQRGLAVAFNNTARPGGQSKRRGRALRCSLTSGIMVPRVGSAARSAHGASVRLSPPRTGMVHGGMAPPYTTIDLYNKNSIPRFTTATRDEGRRRWRSGAGKTGAAGSPAPRTVSHTLAASPLCQGRLKSEPYSWRRVEPRWKVFSSSSGFFMRRTHADSQHDPAEIAR